MYIKWNKSAVKGGASCIIGAVISFGKADVGHRARTRGECESGRGMGSKNGQVLSEDADEDEHEVHDACGG